MLHKKQQRMLKDPVTRRNFFTATAAGTAAGFAALADPVRPPRSPLASGKATCQTSR